MESGGDRKDLDSMLELSVINQHRCRKIDVAANVSYLSVHCRSVSISDFAFFWPQGCSLFIIETVESPMNKELESQDGYDMYLKRLGKLHMQPLKLVFESFELKVNPTYTHIRKEKLNKPDFIHSILAWVSC